MQRPLWIWLVATLALSLACATRQGQHLRDITPPPPPQSVPAQWDFSDPATLAAHRDGAMAACNWLLDVAPATADSKTWSRTRDFALDWIEASAAPKIDVVQPIVAYVATDRRFFYGAYMRGAYQCGKALWLVPKPPAEAATAAQTMDAEFAGVAGMSRLYQALRKWDPNTTSPRLLRYQRKQRQGKLAEYLHKRVAKAQGKARR